MPSSRRRRKALDLSDDRQSKPVAPVEFRGTPLGPIFRAKRVALGLLPAELGWSQLPSTRWKSRPTWLHYEDGDHGAPPGGWSMWYDRLNEAFLERIEFLADMGMPSWDVELNPWSLCEIRRKLGFTVEEITRRLAMSTEP